MAHFETTRVTDGLGFRAQRPNFLTRLSAAVAAWNDARATRRALQALSDHELDDIGLSRGDIEGIVRRID